MITFGTVVMIANILLRLMAFIDLFGNAKKKSEKRYDAVFSLDKEFEKFVHNSKLLRRVALRVIRSVEDPNDFIKKSVDALSDISKGVKRKSKITAAIITKNEEKNIKGCIDSVKGWADEIIVVDGCSVDKTVEIAKSLGAVVIDHKFEGNFARERNISMENTKSQWVLHIDADDRVPEEFKRVVDDTIDRDETVDVYKFRRKSFFLGHFMKYGGWYHFVPNLVRRDKVKFEGVLHERPIYTGRAVEINADVEHYPFDNAAQFVERHNRYSDLEAGRMFNEFGNSKAMLVRKNAIGRSFKIFWKIYVKKKGYKEGMHGMIFSILFAFMNFLVWVKYWELCNNDEKKKGA